MKDKEAQELITALETSQQSQQRVGTNFYTLLWRRSLSSLTSMLVSSSHTATQVEGK